MVNSTLSMGSRISKLLCLSERLDFGAGQRDSDNRGCTVPELQHYKCNIVALLKALCHDIRAIFSKLVSHVTLPHPLDIEFPHRLFNQARWQNAIARQCPRKGRE